MEQYLGMMRLENTTPPHNKFYEIHFHANPDSDPTKADVYVVTTTWGRRGGLGRQRGVRFFVKESAIIFIRKAIAKRVQHGYHVIGIPSLRLNETHE